MVSWEATVGGEESKSNRWRRRREPARAIANISYNKYMLFVYVLMHVHIIIDLLAG